MCMFSYVTKTQGCDRLNDAASDRLPQLLLFFFQGAGTKTSIRRRGRGGRWQWRCPERQCMRDAVPPVVAATATAGPRACWAQVAGPRAAHKMAHNAAGLSSSRLHTVKMAWRPTTQ